jgi:hypothetical protein
MQPIFRFENGTGQIILTPDNPRTKALISLCIEGRPEVRIKHTTDDSLVLEFSEVKPKPVESVVIPPNSEMRGGKLL